MERADLARACRRLLRRFESLPPGRISAKLVPLDDHGGPAVANPDRPPAAAVRATSREQVAAFHPAACAAGEFATEIREVLGLPPDDSSNGLDGRWLALVFEAARAEVAPPPCRMSRAPYPKLLTMAQAAEVARTMGSVAQPLADAEPVEMLADLVEASIALVEMVVERVEIGMVESRSVVVATRPPRAKAKRSPRRTRPLGGGTVGRPRADTEKWMKRGAKHVRNLSMRAEGSKTLATREMEEFCGLSFTDMHARLCKLFPQDRSRMPAANTIRNTDLYKNGWRQHRRRAPETSPPPDTLESLGEDATNLSLSTEPNKSVRLADIRRTRKSVKARDLKLQWDTDRLDREGTAILRDSGVGDDGDTQE